MEQAAPTTQEPKLEIMSLLSMIFAIVGLFIPYLGWALLIAALILGILGLSKINKNPGMYKGKGFALAGIIIFGVGVVLWILILTVLGGLLWLM